VRRIGFGLGRLHHLSSRQSRERIVLGALDAGCSHFDLAPAYGDGLCEAEAGRILVGHRHSVTLGTKFGIPCSNWGARNQTVYYARKIFRKFFSPRYGSEYREREFSGQAAIASLHQSLRRLRTDYIDYFFVHEPRHIYDIDGLAELAPALDQLRQDGKIRHYGIAGTTDLFLVAQDRDYYFGDVTQFDISPRSPAVVSNLRYNHEYFAYGLVRHLRQQNFGMRLDWEIALQWFVSAYADVVPLVATNRLDELTSLRRALASLK
jgi:aryl-alcohol dehydrogenase-like predicted oxidoreductase